MSPHSSGRREAGLFVVFEGIDGAGKSLQVERLAARLEAAGESVLATREPTDGPWGLRYRAWARGEIEGTPEDVLEFFLNDRDEHLRESVRPALARGSIVICDRYVASTRAYQTAAGIERQLLESRLAAHAVPEPDLTCWLRLPVDTALARLERARERFEKAEFLRRVEQVYLELQQQARAGVPGAWPMLEIDAAKPVERVEAQIWSAIAPLL